MDIILQGNLSEATKNVVANCLSTTFVDRLILSCWEGENTDWATDPRITIVKSKDVDNPGIGNRNRQIKSSLAGAKEATAKFVAKMRTDQIISVNSLEMMYQFFLKFWQPNLIFVAGNFVPLICHPRDHLFWGSRENIIELFDIPFDPNPPTQIDQYDKFTRAECYIASHYYALKDERFKKMVENPELYLVDSSPNYLESWSLSNEMRGKIFKVFPRIEMTWPKHNYYGYPYERHSCVEEWHDQSF